MDEKAEKFDFKKFISKSWFYIGIFLIMMIAVIVLMSDRDADYGGEVEYDTPFYYITGNNLYMKEQGKDKVLVSANMFMDPDSRSEEDALDAVLISPDGEYLYFFENIEVDDDGVMTGDFCVYNKNRKKLIEEDTGIYFAASADCSKVLYTKALYGVEGGSGYDDVRHDLYSYDIKDGRKLVEKGVQPEWYNISGDGESYVYTKFYDAATDTASLFMEKDGETIFIDDHMFFYGNKVPLGTHKVNWPLVNRDASRIIYGKRLKYGEMADMYMYSEGQNDLLGERVLQIYVDDGFEKALMVDEYDYEKVTGVMSRVDLDTLRKEKIAEDVWSLGYVEVARVTSMEFIDSDIYLKNYDDVINVADLCMMTPGGEKTLINATDVSNIQYGNDMKTIYGLDYYIEEEGGRVTKVRLDGGDVVEIVKFDEMVKDMYSSPTGRYVTYVLDDDFFIISDSDEKKHIGKMKLEAVGFMDDDEKMYYFAEAGMMMGNVFIRDTAGDSDSTVISDQTHYVWEFEDDKLAFLTEFDFVSKTGTMYLTDCDGKYEKMAEQVEIPLLYNYIQ